MLTDSQGYTTKCTHFNLRLYRLRGHWYSTFSNTSVVNALKDSIHERIRKKYLKSLPSPDDPERSMMTYTLPSGSKSICNQEEN